MTPSEFPFMNATSLRNFGRVTGDRISFTRFMSAGGNFALRFIFPRNGTRATPEIAPIRYVKDGWQSAPVPEGWVASLRGLMDKYGAALGTAGVNRIEFDVDSPPRMTHLAELAFQRAHHWAVTLGNSPHNHSSIASKVED